MDIIIKKIKRDEFKEFNPPEMVLGINLKTLNKLRRIALMKGYNDPNEFIEKFCDDMEKSLIEVV